MTKHPVDQYGSSAANYVARPHYPKAVFEWLAEQAPSRSVAWDCACGNGQASYDLAGYFDTVYASDACAAQIRLTKPDPKIAFYQAAAEFSGLRSASVDLINVGMAVHWFDLPDFYNEVRRIAKPNAIIALLVYGEPEVSNPVINEQVQKFIQQMNPYGPAERSYVKSLYRDLPFPFVNELQMPSMHIEMQMNTHQLATYFRSRSTVINCTKETGSDPVIALEKILSELVAMPEKPLDIKWPMSGRVARIA